MARKWSNINIPGALHYVTGNVHNRIPIFQNETCARGFFKELANLREEWPAKVISYVLMPEHFHLIVNPRDGDIRQFAGVLKSKLARQMVEVGGDRFLRQKPDADGSVHKVWQESFKAIPLWSGWMIWQKINYIHANPVKAGLVKSAKEYRWSSFRVFYEGATDPLPVDQNWWWPDDAQKFSESMKKLGWRTYHHRNTEN